MNINTLTPGERFWVWRRRHNYTRDEIAEHYGVGIKMITAWEKDARKDVPFVRLVAPLTNGECAALLRRRSGLTLHAAAELMGISHVTLIARERNEGDAASTLEWWYARSRD